MNDREDKYLAFAALILIVLLWKGYQKCKRRYLLHMHVPCGGGGNGNRAGHDRHGADPGQGAQGGDGNGADPGQGDQGGDGNGADPGQGDQGGDGNGADPGQGAQGGDGNGADPGQGAQGGDGNGADPGQGGQGGDGNGDGADPEQGAQGGDGIQEIQPVDPHQEADLGHHQHLPLLPDRSSNQAPRTAQVKPIQDGTLPLVDALKETDAAEEYAVSGKLNAKSALYNLSVVLLKLLARKKPSEQQGVSSEPLLNSAV